MGRVATTAWNIRTFLVVAWGAATFFGLAVAALTRIGPVLLMLTPRHGVHVGDVIAFAVAYSAAAAFTVRSLLVNRTSRMS
jgi:hypothetical protein